MKRKLTVMLTMTAVLTLIAAMTTNSMLPSYEELLEAKAENYAKLSKTELFDTMKTQFEEAASRDPESLIPLASVFYERRSEYTPDELLTLIEDNTLDESLRITCVQVLRDIPNYDGSDPRLSALLKKDLPYAVQQTLITYFGNKDGITIDDLIASAASEDEGTAFHAIKKLNQVAPQKAYAVSKDILQSYRNANVGQIQAAVNVFAQMCSSSEVMSKTTDADKKLMYTVIEDVLDDDNYPPTTKDSVVFALADMRTIEEMEFILHHDKIDDVMKKTTVDRNYKTLIDMLKNNPTTEQIEFAVECMELWPIKEIAQPLREAATGKPQLMSANGKLTQNRVSTVLELIEKRGEPANPNWNQ